jgi:hypothetical protein
MAYSGRFEVVLGLEGELTDTWRAAWRDYDWDADDECRPGFRPEIRVTELGPEVWFDCLDESTLEYDTSVVMTAIEACNYGLRDLRAVEAHRRQTG